MGRVAFRDGHCGGMAAILFFVGISHGFQTPREASGVNQTALEAFGARNAGMGTAFGGFGVDANAVVNSPGSINDVMDLTVAFAHAERFAEAGFDNFAALIPLNGRSTLGLAFSRYGVGGVQIREDEARRFEDPRLLNIADYHAALAFARRWGGLDVGANLHLLYRSLDQSGLGIRADLMSQYTLFRNFRAAALLRGLVPAAARWESGLIEYESPDIHLSFASRYPSRYFYGEAHIVYETQGIFQKNAKSESRLRGGRGWEAPLQFLALGSLGVEYLFDMGLSFRMGLRELVSPQPNFGIGYRYRQRIGIDYAFSPHPDLLSSHRVGIVVTPRWKSFDGAGYRNRFKDESPRRPLPPEAGAQPDTNKPGPASEGWDEPGEELKRSPENPAKPQGAPSMEVLEVEDDWDE